MLKSPISKRAKLNRLALLAEKVKKRSKTEPAEEFLLKFQRIQQGLKVAIASLNPEADFDEQNETEILSPLSLEMSHSLKYLAKPNEKPKLTEILALESGVDDGLLECMVRLTRISHGLKEKALKEGVFI